VGVLLFFVVTSVVYLLSLQSCISAVGCPHGDKSTNGSTNRAGTLICPCSRKQEGYQAWASGSLRFSHFCLGRFNELSPTRTGNEERKESDLLRSDEANTETPSRGQSWTKDTLHIGFLRAFYTIAQLGTEKVAKVLAAEQESILEVGFNYETKIKSMLFTRMTYAVHGVVRERLCSPFRYCLPHESLKREELDPKTMPPRLSAWCLSGKRRMKHAIFIPQDYAQLFPLSSFKKKKKTRHLPPSVPDFSKNGRRGGDVRSSLFFRIQQQLLGASPDFFFSSSFPFSSRVITWPGVATCDGSRG